MNKIFPSLASCLTLALAASPASAASQAAPTACSLLTDKEIESVQGEVLQEAKPQQMSETGMTVSQCYFALPTMSKSISLSLTQRGEGAAARDPKEFWKETFDRKKDAREDPEAGEDEKSPTVTRVAGLGDEAFWAASPVGGSLYVLKRHRFIRISVGGPGDQTAKIRKSKILARMILKRL